MKKYLLVGILAGCSGAQPEAPRDDADYYLGVKIGLSTVDGLPGTPTDISAKGVPVIDGVERPDYLPEGINSWDKRATRVTDDNPTGEMRFNYEEASDADSTALDAPDFSGFTNGQERYNYCLLHDCPKAGPALGSHSAAWTSDIYFGSAFTASGSVVSLKGACWTQQNDGLDCEFPAQKNWTWGFLPDDGGVRGGACVVSANHGNQFPFYTNPIQFAQSGFDAWSPAAKTTPVAAVIPSIGVPLSNGREQYFVHCPGILPGSQFGAVMASSGGNGVLTRKTVNIPQRLHDTYPSCNIVQPGQGNPRDLYQYATGELTFDAGNMYDRSILCNANQNDPNMLKFIAMNVFAHERGHALGFFHFTTGVMQTQGNCAVAFSQFRGIPAGFLQALTDYVGGGSTFSFPGSSDSCVVASPTHRTPLPTPSSNSTARPFGNLEE